MEKITKISLALLMMMTIAMAKKDLGNIVKEMSDKMVEMEDRITTNEENLMKAQEELTSLREAPYVHVCGGHWGWITQTSQVISYENLIYSSSNDAGADLDLSTGVFTAGQPGSYTATWSLAASDNAGEHTVSIYLRKNRLNIVESHHYSYYTGESGRIIDQGMFLHR
jgi:hypothetical protein